MGVASWSKSRKYIYTLAFSSLSYGLIFGLYMFVYSGFVPIALVTVVIIAFYAFITYFLFAVPVQLWLRKNSKNFSLVHLFIYTAVAFFAVFLFWHIDNPPIDFAVFRSFIYYIMSIAAAFIYWFWDSIFLRNYNVHRK
ncbi:YopD [Bacillus velezensis M27]|uniref:UPF0715 family protein n=1 Tax=Bacillus TaxID=1386 RepID=UPI00028669BF|nr:MULTISPECIES: UPF0715 family protein [Bacillus]ASF55255.1 hypothetical protein CEG11_09130 [Bacillus velezensis]EKE46773.1 YopD [Bacillus velezensis M27]UJA37521.1 UPF0715 family protein [Bacillus velezensis]UJX19947.1 UPF0715 family protein [Bacillus sp. R45]